jgi:hypothetical protein
MIEYEIAFCENGECRVETYRMVKDSQDVETDENCPGCGRFGRLKDDPKEDTDEERDDQGGASAGS